MQNLLYIVAVVVAVITIVDVARSSLSTGMKAVWIILAFFFSIITGIVWFVWGRKNVSA